MNRRQSLKILAPLAGLGVLIASGGLAGCTGWRVRGAALEFDFEKILVLAPNQSPKIDRADSSNVRFEQGFLGTDLVGRLRQELRTRHKRTLVNQVIDAEVVLKIDSIQRRRSAISFSGGGQIREVELRLEVAYSIEGSSGVILYPTSILDITRTVTTLETAVLANANEEAIQLESMESIVIQQLIRQLATLRNAANPSRSKAP